MGRRFLLAWVLLRVPVMSESATPRTDEILASIASNGVFFSPGHAPIVGFARSSEMVLREVLEAVESPASYLRCKAALDNARRLLESPLGPANTDGNASKSE